MDSTLRIKDFKVGLSITIKRFKSNSITSKIGYIHSRISDDLFSNYGNANGMQIGIGYEAKLTKYSRAYISYSYDFLKLRKTAFRDYDTQKITLGFNI